MDNHSGQGTIEELISEQVVSDRLKCEHFGSEELEPASGNATPAANADSSSEETASGLITEVVEPRSSLEGVSPPCSANTTEPDGTRPASGNATSVDTLRDAPHPSMTQDDSEAKIAMRQGKIQIAKNYKDTGDEAVRSGKHQEALRPYHYAISYLRGLDSDTQALAMKQSAASDKIKAEPSEVEELMGSIHSNMSLCHYKRYQSSKDKDILQRMLACANDAIKNTPKNPKALRRKSWALKEQGMFSQARKALGELELIDPNSAQPLLMEINQKEQESQNTADAQMRGWLSRGRLE